MHKRFPKLLEKRDLPYDASAVHGVPGVVGRCIVLCRDYILVLDHRTTHAVAVNMYVVCPFYSPSLSLSLFPFALRSEKTRRLSIDATK